MDHLTGSWIAQQLRWAFPEDSASRYLLLDRDGKYEGEATEVLTSMNSRLIRTVWLPISPSVLKPLTLSHVGC